MKRPNCSDSSSSDPANNRASGRRALPAFVFAAGLLIVLMLASLMIGPALIPLRLTLSYLTDFSAATREHVILDVLRAPRMLAVLLIGASLGTAGCIMQAITRNPLASPGVFGINAGASFIIVFCTIVVPGAGGLALAGAGFVGALLTVGLVLLMGAAVRGGQADVRMALVGIVIQALLSSFTQGLLIFNEESAAKLLFWLAGSAAGIQREEVAILLPVVLAGLFAAMFLGRSLSLIGLGEEMARGLGQRIWIVRTVGTLIVVLLAGVSVSIAGPIGFVGLIVPHICRYLIGTDYRLLLPFSALVGAVLLTAADVGSRFIDFPAETPVGLVTALIGAPYFIALARRSRRSP
ncbi:MULTISPECIES: FecCD family ABC transporter permease [Saccharibacillus]|uniref:FecCD family ABC transporter permease n=1 Tax=Saccharibacillus TaxID=456492 RepID=UPI00123C0F12|nr:iron ABC transporter permease [Saccharibacillus sp. WB 17]MWJ31183.1 iron chelate uptake ABC transporter family permease subunit [Saccharibacillus sp. WB 17]